MGIHVLIKEIVIVALVFIALFVVLAHQSKQVIQNLPVDCKHLFDEEPVCPPFWTPDMIALALLFVGVLAGIVFGAIS